MAGAGSAGRSGSGLPSTRSSVTATPASWYRSPDTQVCYKPSPSSIVEPPFERPYEFVGGQVVAGDCGLDVTGADHRRPGFGKDFESHRPSSRHNVVDEAGNLVRLHRLARLHLQPPAPCDPAQRRDDSSPGRLRA